MRVNRLRHLVPICAAPAILVLIVCRSSACIPPPLHFERIESNPSISEKALVISASDAVFKGEQEHPSGAVYFSDDFCKVVLDVHAGPGANAALNVMGSSNPDVMFGSGKEWTQELAPIAITNSGNQFISTKIKAPLRHRVVEFFLSTPENPGKPDVGLSVGGSIQVYATAIPCPR